MYILKHCKKRNVKNIVVYCAEKIYNDSRVTVSFEEGHEDTKAHADN